MGATRTAAATSSGAHSPELAALAKGGAWGAVYDALKGPCMAHAVELQSGAATKTGGKKGGAEKIEHSVSPALAACLDNMARCAEVSCGVRTCVYMSRDRVVVKAMPERNV